MQVYIATAGNGFIYKCGDSYAQLGERSPDQYFEHWKVWCGSCSYGYWVQDSPEILEGGQASTEVQMWETDHDPSCEARAVAA